jgi:hypothetical protein
MLYSTEKKEDRMPALEELEEQLARLKQVQSVIEAEHFSHERPLEEQFEEWIRELRQQLAQQKAEQEQVGRQVKQEE